MSLLKNFKNADHTFEKIFFKGIILLTASFIFFYAIDKLLDTVPEILELYKENRNYFIGFAVLIFLVYTFTFSLYARTLDVFEEETELSQKASITGVRIWIVFWILWGLFCGWIFNKYSNKISLIITILLLLLLPIIVAFFISKSIRKEILKDEEEMKERLLENYTPYNYCLDKKYYSGYYAFVGIIAFMVLLIFLNKLTFLMNGWWGTSH